MNKKSFLKSIYLKAIFIPALCILLIMLPLLNGCSKKPVEIQNIILSKNVDINGNPTEESDVFASGTQEIFLVIKITDMKSTDNITAKWTFLDENIEIDSKTFIPEEKFSGNHVFKIKISQGFPFGNYEVSVFLNGKQVKTISFKVE
ncbi:MAG: hypothetical protein PHU65_03530 [Actinomycetota bacterium]|jgi:uncharacterized protein YfaS (alpha-2-macroglobulin family)|nr:hypothetical protein [Actinomycetota bacterium]